MHVYEDERKLILLYSKKKKLSMKTFCVYYKFETLITTLKWG